jgi:hypothetical protein
VALTAKLICAWAEENDLTVAVAKHNFVVGSAVSRRAAISEVGASSDQCSSCLVSPRDIGPVGLLNLFAVAATK